MQQAEPQTPAKAWWRTVRNLLVILLIFLVVKAFLQRQMVSGEAPELYGLLVDGAPVTLEDYQGQPVLLHFWATWCRICRLEQNGIEAISQDWPVLTVAMQSGSAQELQLYMDEHGLTHPVVVDPTGALAAQFGVFAVPATFIIDAEGNIRFRERGYTTSWGLRARLLAARWLSG